MILLHQCLILLFLAWLNGPDNDFSEAQNGYLYYGEKKHRDDYRAEEGQSPELFLTI
jgi:hypothetical protein